MLALGCSVTAALLALLALPGCETPRKSDASPQQANDELKPVSYTELRRKYNERADRIDQLWARAVVEAEWTTPKGEGRFEQGDGPLIVRKPSELALAVGKLGNTMYWLGCDAERFWLFDLNPPDGKPTAAWVGRHEAADRPRRGGPPVPVQPKRLIALLGIRSLPPDSKRTLHGPIRAWESAAGQASEQGTLPPLPERGHWVSHPLKRAGEASQRWRLLYVLDGEARPRLIALHRQGRDSSAYQPRRVLRSGGGAQLIAGLSRYERLPLHEKPPGAWPKVATRIEVRAPKRKATLTLFLRDLTDGKADGKVRDVQFDFDKLLEIHQPERVRRLSADRAEPGNAP